MTEAYRDALDAVIPALQEFVEQFFSSRLEETPFLFDAVVQEMLRVVGQRLTLRVAERLGGAAVECAKARGYRIERSPMITFWTVFGPVTVASPYLTRASAEGGVRPVNTALRVRSSGRSLSLQRAMCDFGIDESFEGAARKLHEHYGLEVNRTTFLRTVEKHGTHVSGQSSFAGMEARYERPVEGPGVPHLVEMDGSCVRTGSLAPKEGGGTTPKRGLLARTRTTEWRDLRLAFVRRLDQDDARFEPPAKTSRPAVATRIQRPDASGRVCAGACVCVWLGRPSPASPPTGIRRREAPGIGLIARGHRQAGHPHTIPVRGAPPNAVPNRAV